MTDPAAEPSVLAGSGDIGEGSPAAAWDREALRRSLDELFTLTRHYRSGQAYRELLGFVARFRFYSPYNAMLVYVQLPGARFVAPPHRWLYDYGRRIKTGARPLVILRPMGPVMFVFDVSDTEPEADAPPLPSQVERPFHARAGSVGRALPTTIGNARRDGVEVIEAEGGSQSAGYIRGASPGRHISLQVKEHPEPEFRQIPLRYELVLNARHPPEARYATLVHELAHLYCGHLGTPNERWWPDRRGLSEAVRELEAESVSYLICQRLGIDSPSEAYLSSYVREGEDIPSISLECVMKTAGVIEQLGRERLPPRKDDKE